MSNRNRTAGNNFERDIVKNLRERGWDVHTSRFASKMLDNEGIDLYGDYPRKVQCKASVNTPKIHDLLTTTAADTIFWRRMEKHKTQFYAEGEYVILNLEDFLNIIDKAYEQTRSVKI